MKNIFLIALGLAAFYGGSWIVDHSVNVADGWYAYPNFIMGLLITGGGGLLAGFNITAIVNRVANHD